MLKRDIARSSGELRAALNSQLGQNVVHCGRIGRFRMRVILSRHIDQNVPGDLGVHLICDNYATHKHPNVRTWLARRPRYHVHFTPIYASWLNQVERWFGLITQQGHSARLLW